MLQADEFWDFSCQLYADEGVASACLHVQDALDLNVNMILFCFYADTQGCYFSKAEYAACHQAIHSHAQALEQHREKRKGLKGTASYEAMLEQELSMEKYQQEQIVTYFNSVLRQREMRHDDADTCSASNGFNNLNAYLNSKGLSEVQCQEVRSLLTHSPHLADKLAEFKSKI